MGQRGYRKRRYRCALVDPRSGLRCHAQVRRAGNTFCSHAHAVLARTAPRDTGPASRARRQAARQALLDQLQAALEQVAAGGPVPVPVALPIVAGQLDAQYEKGYHAGLLTAQKRTRALRLTESQASVERFLGSRFGKAFIGGQLSPNALARFRFVKRP